VFFTILRCHVREGHLQYLRNLEADLMDADQADSEPQAADASESTFYLSNDKNDGISCELGIRYPTLQAILSGKKNVQITTVCSDSSDSIYELVHLLHNMIFIYELVYLFHNMIS
jgi:hypothetical protein